MAAASIIYLSIILPAMLMSAYTLALILRGITRLIKDARRLWTRIG